MTTLADSIYSNEELISEYVKLVNDSIRLAYKFAENEEYYKNIGATTTTGKKYIKVITCNGSSGGCVHAFIDSDMNVYKPAGYNALAKGIRYNLNNDIDRLRKILDNKNAYTGAYLYR